MDANTKNPIEILTETLATMTARAVEAERERDAAIASSNDWYSMYQRKDEELGKEKEAHAATKKELQDLLDQLADDQ